MDKLNINNVIFGYGSLYNNPIKIERPPDGVIFGKFCAIGPNLKIIGYNHDYNFPAVQKTFYKKYFNIDHPIDYNFNTYSKGKIIIGNDVWIGEDVTILSGVKIGDGCCIGKGSIITKSLEPYTICVGIPCKEIKKRYNDKMKDFLLELKWWDWTDEKIKKNKNFFITNLNNFDVDYIKSIIVEK